MSSAHELRCIADAASRCREARSCIVFSQKESYKDVCHVVISISAFVQRRRTSINFHPRDAINLADADRVHL